MSRWTWPQCNSQTALRLLGKVGEKLIAAVDVLKYRQGVDKIVKHGSEVWLFFPQHTHTTSIQTRPQRRDYTAGLNEKINYNGNSHSSAGLNPIISYNCVKKKKTTNKQHAWLARTQGKSNGWTSSVVGFNKTLKKKKSFEFQLCSRNQNFNFNLKHRDFIFKFWLWSRNRIFFFLSSFLEVALTHFCKKRQRMDEAKEK